MKSHAILLHLPPVVNHLFVQHILPVSQLVATSITRSTVTISQSSCSSPFFYLIKASEYKHSDADNSSMPKRSRKALPLSEKVKVLDFIRKEKKNHMVRLLIYSKNKSSIWEIVKKEKKKCVLVLLSHVKLQKLPAQWMISA